MPSPVLSPADLQHRALRLPRLDLAHLPTPLEEAPRLADSLDGPRIFIKRDDCTGMLLGGNKTRHNEFLLADALHRDADLLVWGAGIQSNNCRQTAAACAKLGLECHLYLSRATHPPAADDLSAGRRSSGEDVQGNLLLDYLVGARVHIVDEPLGPALDELLHKRAAEFRAAGRKPYVWDRDHGRPLAAVSYALCLGEIVEQMHKLCLEPAAVYCAAAGATGAGLVLGKAVLGLSCDVKLLCPIRWPWNVPEDLAEVANRAAGLLGLPHRVTTADVDVRDDYIGPGYGVLTQEGWEALALLATTEGILLDPVYTSKALAGLIDDVRRHRVRPDGCVVFIHTGGVPAVFAYRDELLKHLQPGQGSSGLATQAQHAGKTKGDGHRAKNG
jgi:1-aminocyclopropane-1-carboxylate deaminase/D-cysteine desulfhydrase-like pyridoxal-dependent ACC family enzyme